MKSKTNIFLIIVTIIFLLMCFFGCGPSAEEIHAREQAMKEMQLNAEVTAKEKELETVGPNYIRLIASAYNQRNSGVEVYLIGSDTIVVIAGRDGAPVILKK